MKLRWLLVAAGIALLVLPYWLKSYELGLLTKMLILGLFAMSLNILMGYCGLPSLGHAAYFGVGAYTAGLLALHVIDNFWLDFGAAVVVSALTAAAFGLLSVRTQGGYFLLITLALAQVLWGIAFGWRWLTGGDDGIPGVPRPGPGLPFSLADDIAFYYFVLAVCVLLTLLMHLILRSPFGRALVGIRESERRMEVLGYDTWLYKLVAFVIAGTFAGCAGALFVYFNNFVNPAYLSLVFSANAMIMVILGGTGTLLGPAIGAGLMVLLENAVSAWTERWLLVLGVVYVLVVMFAPQGLLGLLRRAAPPGREKP